MASCDLCGKHFANRYQLGPHRRCCWARLNGDGADDFSASSSSGGLSNSAESSGDDDEDADDADDADDTSTEVDAGRCTCGLSALLVCLHFLFP